MTPPPVLGVSSSISLPAQAPPTAGHIVGQQQLASYLEKALDVGPHNIVLFLQDKVNTWALTLLLSVLDFLKNFLWGTEAKHKHKCSSSRLLLYGPSCLCAWSCSLFTFIRSFGISLFNLVKTFKTNGRRPHRSAVFDWRLKPSLTVSLCSLWSKIFMTFFLSVFRWASRTSPCMEEPLGTSRIMCFQTWRYYHDETNQTERFRFTLRCVGHSWFFFCHRELWCHHPPLWFYLLFPGPHPMQWLASCRTNWTPPLCTWTLRRWASWDWTPPRLLCSCSDCPTASGLLTVR